MKELLSHKYPLLLVLVSLVLLLPHLDVIYVNIMEARNFITAREMVVNDNWLLTTINSLPRYEKPPLPTWLTALAGVLFGFDNLYGLRLPVVLITAFLVLMAYQFSKKLGLSEKQSFHNGLLLITSFYIFFGGRDNQWDMYTHSFMMASLYFLWKLLQEDTAKAKNALLSGLFFGLSFLSKGPISLYALFLPFLIAYGFTYGFKLKSRWHYGILVVVLGIVLGLSWPLYVRFADPQSFIETTTREATRWASYNTRPFFYYWSFFTQSGIWAIPSLIALLYPYMKTRVTNLKAYRFTLFWTLASVVLLSLIPEKKSRYLLPVLIPMALNTGFYVEYLFEKFKTLAKNEKWLAYFAFGLLGIIALAIPFILPFVLKNLNGFWLWYVLVAIASLICGIIIIRSLLKNNFGRAFYSIIAFEICIVTFGLPLIGAFLENPDYYSPKELHVVKAKENIEIYDLQNYCPEMIWEYGESIPLVADNGKIRIPKENRFGLLVNIDEKTKLMEVFGGYKIEKLLTVDMNPVPKSKKSYKKRLQRDFYIVSR
ncbi:4-amino-4-deoxy-L-arabinose transferase-like glycosyltransferase [Flavobacterium sp. 28YEA47A]|uniref:ArnT family glycosyltransferase n=1 Tax=Flavobacterium sp. 28YEA47A TaxID=3156276 RepID=UPI00351358BD